MTVRAERARALVAEGFAIMPAPGTYRLRA
jgi:hypothetical protein